MKELRVKVSIRNNLLLSAIEAAGFKNQSEFARACEIPVWQLNNLIGMRASPIGDDGSFTPASKAVMEVLGAAPSDLWTDEQLTLVLPRSTATSAMALKEAFSLMERSEQTINLPSPEEAYERHELSALVEQAISHLTPREAFVVRMTKGLSGAPEHALHEVARKLSVSIERVRQIQGSAFRKLRHPKRSTRLLEALGYEWGPVIAPLHVTDTEAEDNVNGRSPHEQ